MSTPADRRCSFSTPVDLALAPVASYLGAMPEVPALRRGHIAIPRRARCAATHPPMN